MRLLFLIYSLGGGGAERVITNLANYWVEKGWEITIVTLAPQAEDSYGLSAGVKRIELGLAGESGGNLTGLARNLCRIFAIRRILQRTQPDIALGVMAHASVLLALASWGLKKISTIGLERVYPPQHPLGFQWEWLRSNSYAGLTAVAVQSTEGAKWLRRHTNAKHVVVIPNSVQWPLPKQFPQLDLRDNYPFKKKILLGVGRLTSQKQFDLLVSCFQTLATSHPEWVLVILGEGPLRLALEAQVAVAGLEQRVFLPGRAGNIGEWYEHSDIFVLSSRFEGFPNALIEAMAYGLPVVSFDCNTGPRDIIRDKVDGLLVPLESTAGLTEALDQLMSDESLRQNFARQAVNVRERFSEERIIDMWEEVFRKIAK